MMDPCKLDAVADALSGLANRVDAYAGRRRDARDDAEKIVSASDAKRKVQTASREALYNALNHPGTDPKVRKMIEAELDDRANRGS